MESKVLALMILCASCAEAAAKECDYGGPKAFLSRVVAVDSQKGDGGEQSVRPSLVLNGKEIVLTFDQGPHGAYTKNILDILDRHCVKATFFMTGSAALKYASEVRDVAQRGHTLAASAWSPGADFQALSFEAAKVEIDKSLAAVAQASNGPAAPFVRLNAKNLAPDLVSHLKDEEVSDWPADVAAGDLEPGLSASKLANRAIAQVQAAGKGVIQFHDTSRTTVDALDSILLNLKLAGFKVVHAVPAGSYTPKPEYLAELSKPADPAVMPSRVSHALVETVKRRAREAEDEAPRARQRQRMEREAAVEDAVQRAYRLRLRKEREAALDEQRLRELRARRQRQMDLAAARERALQERALQQRAYQERAYQERAYRERASQ
jgi:peptidoglycan-N-acetylglucosamine deacetylase